MKNVFYRLFVRNLRYKVFALCLGVAIWYSMTVRSIRNVPVGPVERRFFCPKNFQVHEEEVAQISLTLNCPSYINEEYNLSEQMFAVEIVLGPKVISEEQLANAEDYTSVATLSLHSGLIRSRLPEKAEGLVRVESITPKQLDVPISLITKRVPLIPQLRGKPQEGYVARQLEPLSLQEIELTGAPEDLARIEELELPPIDVAGLSKDATVQVEIDRDALKSERQVWPVRDADRKVYIRVPIEKAIKTRTLPAVRVRVSNAPPSATVRIEPDSVEVLVEGRPSQLDQIIEDRLAAELDLAGFGDGTFHLPPEIRPLPEGVKIIQRSADLIQVVIQGSGPKRVLEPEITK